MRRAFTLLELMVVVGIMAFLGIASASSYNALRQGMAERSAVDAASAVLRAAKERALVDRVPTAVFCWNRCVQEADPSPGGADAVVVGEVVAVRRSGRITRAVGNLLFDEFGDLERSYDAYDDAGELEKHKGFRLWYMSENGGGSMRYSTVANGVFDGLVDGWSFMPLADGTGSSPTNIKIRACAFLRKRDHGGPNWTVGAAYGLEFQRMRLPGGFLFGSGSPPTSLGAVREVKAITFDPGGLVSDGEVDISFFRAGADGNPDPTSRRTVGTASSREETGGGRP